MKVLIAVDSSSIAEKAFDYYMNKIHKEGSQIIVCHEEEQPDVSSLFSRQAAGEKIPEDQLKSVVDDHCKKCTDLKNVYTEKCKQYKDLDYKVVVDDTSASKGKVGPGILKTAENLGANMIVIGSRGHGVLRRTVLGCVCDYVLHHAKVPVMICHK